MVSTGELKTKISLDSAQFKKSMAGVNRQLKGLKQEQKAVTSSGNGFARGLKELNAKSDVLTRTLKVQKGQVSELKRKYDDAKNATGDNSKATQKANTAYQKARAEMNKTENQLKGVTSAIEKQVNPWKKLSRSASDAGDKLQTAGRGMSNFGRGMTTKVTLPILAAGGAIFKTAMDFESGFTSVEKTVDGTAQEMTTLKSAIRDMAKEIPASTAEISEVAEAAGQLGVKVDDVEEFTRVMIDMGNSTNLSAKTAATEFARFANIVGMSQDDFDKLGSSTVALGNNFATTESEISAMSLRLAAQGKQVGLSEAEILALGASMSSLGIKSEAGGSAMSKVLKKIDGAVDKSGDKLTGFAKVAGVSSSKFAKAWEEDATGALDLFIKGLSKSSEEGDNLTTILDDLGIKGIRESDTILRLAGASDLLSTAVDTSSKAWKDNSALAEEAGKRYETSASQLKIMWNRVKDVAITLGGALVPAVMDALDAAEPLIEKIESGAQAFTEMNEEEQGTILKMIAFAATIGPVSLVLGGLTTTLGGVAKGVGGVAGLLGKAGGKGLLGKVGLMGLKGGPVALAIAGVGALGLGIYALTKETGKSLEETVKSIEARKKEIDSTEKMISQYEKLRLKNKLSTDEVLRYMDIMTELKDAKSEETIAKLKDEQAELLEKSGFTNDEMDRFLELNGDVVEKTPEASKVVSEHGNAYAGVADEVKRLNDAERKRLTDETYIALTSELEKQRDRLAEQKELKQELSVLEDEQVEKLEFLTNKTKLVKDLDLKIVDLKKDMKTASEKELPVLQEKLDKAEHDRRIQGKLLEADRDQFTNLLKKIAKKKDEIGLNEDELKQFDMLKGDYAQMVLYEQGIVSEKGKANEAIRTEQKEIDTAKSKLEKLWNTGKITRAEYEKQNGELKEQQRKIDVAKGKLQDMNEVAGKTIYKGVNVKTDPSINWLNTKLGEGVNKKVSITESVERVLSYGPSMLGYGGGIPHNAKGTNNHPGGPMIAGEEGFELGRMGNKWDMLNLGAYDKPAGYEVFTNKESKKIISALNRMPGYAGGASKSGEAGRTISKLNSQESGGRTINQYLTINSPEPLTPSETARLQKQATRQLAMEW